MTNTKVTRKALLLSAMSLLLCISMLLGTTFAWFTDSVTSSGNRIISGILDVELYHKNAKVTDDEAIGNTTELFKDALGSSMLWEPGAVSFEQFTVANVGTLALKYQMNFIDFANNFVVPAGATENNGKSLLDVLRVRIDESGAIPQSRPAYSADDPTLGEFRAAGALTKKGTLTPSETKSVTMILYWPSDTETLSATVKDNDYNLKNGAKASDAAGTDVGQLWVDFKVQLIATQLSYENDSFDNTYDASADGTAAWSGVPVANVASTAPVTAAPTTDLEITKSGDILSATVAADAAAGVFDDLKDDTAESNELTLNLNVTKTNETTTQVGTTVDLDIDMSAIMKSTTGDVTTTKTENVSTFDDYLTINYDLGTGKNVTAATHKGLNMVNSTDTADDLGDGIYNYDATTGILTIKTKTLSPFAVAYTVPATAVALPEEASVAMGETTTLTAAITPSDSTDAVTFTSSDETVATVDANGVVTGVATGTATVTATAGSASATCAVTVILPPVAKIGTVGYASVQAAFDAAAEGDTILLCRDEALTEGVNFDQDVTATFDLGGHTLKSANENINTLLTVSAGDLSLKNGKIENIVHAAEGESTTIYAVKLSGGAKATEIKDVAIKVSGTGIFLTGASRIGTLNATVDAYTDVNGYCSFDAINVGEGCTIALIDGGKYSSTMPQSYLLSHRSGKSYNDSYPLLVDGRIDLISGGEFIDCYGSAGYSNNIRGSIGEISGGYFGYAEWGCSGPCRMFTGTEKIEKITGGTFESGGAVASFDLDTGASYGDLKTVVTGSGCAFELVGQTTQNVYFSTSERAYTANVYKVVAAN